jgi:dihydrofolate synthase / folylpolyglutamate synthase
MDYKSAIKYLESFKGRGMVLGLDRVKKLLKQLGDPQDSFLSIHVAGTNGKGSVCAMMSSILTKAGYRTGLYTSPHLVDYTERVRINEKDISKAKFASAVAKVKRAINKMPSIMLTEFEVLTAAGFVMLKEQKVKVAIIEVGLGGRLDATNVISPIISVITNIDLDHMDMLGESIDSIAAEKAGIIKRGVPVVTAATKGLLVIKSKCRQNNASLFHCLNTKVDLSPLNGEHQKINTALVLCTIKQLTAKGFVIGESVIRSGLKATRWPGRLQIVSKKPFIVVDSAHNEPGAKVLAQYISAFRKKFVFIIGMQQNKDVNSYLARIRPLAKAFVVVRSSNPASLPHESLVEKLKLFKGPIVAALDIRDSVKYAKELGDNICVTGSIYLLGDFYKHKLFDLMAKISV